MSPTHRTATNSRPIRLLLVDAHERSRSSSRALFDTLPELEVVGEAGEHDEALALAGTCKPDVVVIGMRVDGSSGERVTRDLVGLHPRVPVVFWTLFDGPEYRQAALAAGAASYVLKEAPTSDLLDAIRTAMQRSSDAHS